MPTLSSWFGNRRCSLNQPRELAFYLSLAQAIPPLDTTCTRQAYINRSIDTNQLPFTSTRFRSGKAAEVERIAR